MKGKRLFLMALGIIKRLRDPYYQGLAAELAFYFIMSIVPVFILLASLLGFFSISTDVVHDLVTQYATEDVVELIGGYLSYKPTGTVNIIFLVFALWGASKIQFSLVKISNYAYSGKPRGNGYVRERLRSIVNIALILFMLTFSLLILVYGEVLLNLISMYAEKYLKLVFNVDRIWLVLRWPIAIALYFLIVSINYYFLPAKRVPYHRVIPGSIAASCGILVSTLVYSFYVAKMANYDLLYGSLASIVALLLWFYILGTVLVLGILVNVSWFDATVQAPAGDW